MNSADDEKSPGCLNVLLRIALTLFFLCLALAYLGLLVVGFLVFSVPGVVAVCLLATPYFKLWEWGFDYCFDKLNGS
jgi:hypothetical protein